MFFDEEYFRCTEFYESHELVHVNKKSVDEIMRELDKANRKAADAKDSQ